MTQLTETEMAQAVLQALLELKEDGPAYGTVGICTNVADKLYEQDGSGVLEDYWETSRDTAFTNWDDTAASGCATYPIKGNYLTTSREMWLDGEYAAARWRLVDHLIEHYTSLAEEE